MSTEMNLIWRNKERCNNMLLQKIGLFFIQILESAKSICIYNTPCWHNYISVLKWATPWYTSKYTDLLTWSLILLNGCSVGQGRTVYFSVLRVFARHSAVWFFPVYSWVVQFHVLKSTVRASVAFGLLGNGWMDVLYVIALINSSAIANALMYVYMCLEGVVHVFYWHDTQKYSVPFASVIN